MVTEVMKANYYIKYHTCVFFLFLMSCSSEPQDFIYDYSPWVERIDTLQFNLEGSGLDSILQYTFVERNPSSWVIYYRIPRSFLKFDEDKNFKYAFGSPGRGPLEFNRFHSYFFSYDNSMYLLDSGSAKMIVYTDPIENSYEFEFSENQAVDFAVSKDGTILVYRLSSASEFVLALYDNKGNLLKEFFKPEDSNFKLFLGRFREGKVQYRESVDRFYFLYPDSFDIYEISPDGTITDTLQFSGRTVFTNTLSGFPENLNPFEFDSGHWRYWESMNHPMRFYFLGKNHILLENYSLEVHDRTPEYTMYYNLYSLDGETVFEGLVLDELMQIRAGSDDGGLIVTDGEYLLNVYFKF